MRRHRPQDATVAAELLTDVSARLPPVREVVEPSGTSAAVSVLGGVADSSDACGSPDADLPASGGHGNLAAALRAHLLADRANDAAPAHSLPVHRNCACAIGCEYLVYGSAVYCDFCGPCGRAVGSHGCECHDDCEGVYCGVECDRSRETAERNALKVDADLATRLAAIDEPCMSFPPATAKRLIAERPEQRVSSRYRNEDESSRNGRPNTDDRGRG